MPTLLWALAAIPAAILAVVMVVVAARAAGAGRETAEAIGVTAGGMVLLAWAMALVVALPDHRRRVLGASNGTPLRTITTGVGVGVALVVVAGAIVAGGAALDPNVERRIAKAGLDLNGPGWRVALLVVAIVVLAPVGEELLFRGLVLRTLTQRFTFGVSAVVTSLVFAGSHADAYVIWPRAVAVFVLGLGLAWICRRRGMAASIVAHATVNGVAVLGSFFGQ